MYRIKSLLLSVVLTFSFLAPAHSAPVLVDGREWMQVSDITNYSWAQLDIFYFDRFTGQLKNPATHHIIGGVDVTGWTWASVYDVKDMLLSLTYLGPDATCSTFFECYERNSAWAPKFTNDFTPTASHSYGDSVIGITRTLNSIWGNPLIYVVHDRFDTTSNDYITAFETTSRHRYNEIWGIWLYREVSAPDADGDGVPDEDDNCPVDDNPGQEDQDGDDIGDACDDDIDGDGVNNDVDNCPIDVNAGQEDFDEDTIGDACDDDIDGDTVANDDDFCPDNTVTPEEGVPLMGNLNPKHWALTVIGNGFDFDTVTKGKGKGPNRSYTIEDTAGCSCEQIVEIQGLGDGHTKYGCSISAMDDWLDFVNP